MVNQIFIGPPVPPTRITINGKDEATDLATKSTGTIDIGYDISSVIQSGHYRKTRAVFVLSSDNFKTTTTFYDRWYIGPTFFPGDNRFHFVLHNLVQNTKYRVRAYTEVGGPEMISTNYNGFEWWMNRTPNLPQLVTPTENQTFVTTAPIPFDWKFSDPDPGEDQGQYQLRWRNIADDRSPGPWFTVSGGSTTSALVPTGENFQSNRFYEWQVRYTDKQNLWGPWSLTRSFYIQGGQSPPTLVSPVKDTAVDVTQPLDFIWRFRDPESGDTQARADFRYRVVGETDWVILPDVSTDDTANFTLDANILLPEFHYEWQVQTYDVGSGGADPSDWSASGRFFSIATPGRDAEFVPLIDQNQIHGALGCGDNRVFIYQQGGKVRVGEITSISQVVWTRKRDDISNCVVDTSGFDYDCGQLLKDLRCWQHELVVFRDGVRVWEGPITRLTYSADNVEVEAKDVMGYVYRRIMRQGYNDAYNCTKQDADGNCIGLQLGLKTVVERSTRIIIDALGRGDPNVLPYLTPLNNPHDARQSRNIPDFAKTAWEEVDDLAQTAGLDYTVVGRRILLFDTHYPVGKLPELRDGDFTDPVIVSEYGMSLCNYYGVTDGSGIWGAAYPIGLNANTYKEFYGPVELLSSSYGDSTDDANASTPAGVQRLRESYASQAQRNIGHRWPTPVIVRVPDNTTLRPETAININHLVPGMWVPLRSTASLREVSQWQKLDFVTVTQTERGETVQVVMGPAPNGGNDDPDATGQDGDTG